VHALFLREQHPAAARLEAAGVRTRFFDASRADLLRLYSVTRAIIELRPDVVHTTQQASNVIGRFIKVFEPDISLVSGVIDFDRLPLVLRLLHGLLPRPDAGIFVSKAVRDATCAEQQIDAARAHVIYNALDLTRVAASAGARARLRTEWNIEPDAPVLGMVGRLHPEKRVLELLRAAPELRRRVPGLRIVMAGDGPERGRCEELIDTLGLRDTVTLLGFRTDIYDVLSALDVVAMLCPHEACSFAAIEAFVLRRAVLAAGSGGLAEMVTHGVSGMHVTPDDPASLVENAARLLLDADLRQRLAEQAYAQARQFGLENHLTRLQGVYSQRRMTSGVPAFRGSLRG
jgi:glycosyltransferase involved in cell wall biosynthesis